MVGVVLTYNEAEHIAACIDSLKSFLAHVLVLDSGSRDRTRDIARESGAMVVLRPFSDFASQRQAALDMVKQEWVLFVDADERVTAELAAEIAAFSQNKLEARDFAGANMPRLNHIIGRTPHWGGFSPDRQLRLLRPKRTSFADSPPVHEHPKLQGKVFEFQHSIVHFNYQTWRQFHAKQQRYAELESSNAERDMALPLLSMSRRFLRLFYYRYIELAGWRDGLLGFKLALLLAWYYGFLPIFLALFSETADTSG